jgi:hypothetical protein
MAEQNRLIEAFYTLEAWLAQVPLEDTRLRLMLINKMTLILQKLNSFLLTPKNQSNGN